MLGNNENLQAENTNSTNSNLIVWNANLITGKAKGPVEEPGWLGCKEWLFLPEEAHGPLTADINSSRGGLTDTSANSLLCVLSASLCYS